MLYRLNKFLLLLVILLLTACAGQQKISPAQSLEYAKNAIRPLQWDMRGKIAFSNESTNWYANFFWQKRTHQQTLSFNGPFGDTYFMLKQVQQENNTMLNSLMMNNETVYASSLSELIEQYSDIQVPIESLEYWLFAQVNPDFPADLLGTDPKILLTRFKQQGWLVNFSYNNESLPFPVKVIAQSAQIKVKAFISERQEFKE